MNRIGAGGKCLLSPRPAKRGEGGEQRSCEPGEGCFTAQKTLSRLTPSAFATLSRKRERGRALRRSGMKFEELRRQRGALQVHRHARVGERRRLAVEDLPV